MEQRIREAGGVVSVREKAGAPPRVGVETSPPETSSEKLRWRGRNQHRRLTKIDHVGIWFSLEGKSVFGVVNGLLLLAVADVCGRVVLYLPEFRLRNSSCVSGISKPASYLFFQKKQEKVKKSEKK